MPLLTAALIITIIRLTIAANNGMINDARNWGWDEIERMARNNNRQLIRSQKIIIVMLIICYACIIIL